jgi:hypothetical protein
MRCDTDRGDRRGTPLSANVRWLRVKRAPPERQVALSGCGTRTGRGAKKESRSAGRAATRF